MAMPNRTRVRAATFALLVALAAAPAASLAQDGDEQVTDPSGTGACAGWGGMLPPTNGSRIPVCTMTTLTTADLASRFPGLVLPPPLGAETTIIEMPDPGRDQFLISDDSIPDGADPATDILGTYHAEFELNASAARRLRRWFVNQVPDDARMVSGQPLQRAIRSGAWEWFFLHLASDPTSRPEAPRVYQLAFQGPAERSVRHSALWTDAGSDRVGADGSIYYNTPPGHIVILSSEGVQFLVPAKADPLGAFRPSAWDSEAWDFASTPEAPTAFIPASGQVFDTLDAVSMLLVHQPIAEQSFRLAGTAQEGIQLPSYLQYPSASSLFDALSMPAPLVIHLVAQGEDLEFDQLLIAPLESIPGLFTFEHGLTGYGLYCIEDVSIPGDVAMWVDGQAFTPTEAQIMGELGDDLRRGPGVVVLPGHGGPGHPPCRSPGSLALGPAAPRLRRRVAVLGRTRAPG